MLLPTLAALVATLAVGSSEGDISDCATTNKTILDAPCQGYDCLLQYVQKDDGMFSWTDTGLRLNGTNDAVLPKNKKSWTGYVLNVTSQAWLTPQDFNFTPFGGVPRGHIWWHILVVIIPSNRRPGADQSFLYMTGGTNSPGPTGGVPDASSEDITVVSSVAMGTGLVGATLFQTPNQHMVFAADPLQKHRSEDAVIAFTWKRFVQDPTRVEWPLRLPMTKGGVKAMDAVQLFMKAHDGTVINSFAVAGASKRGWTTWTVGAVDPRVFTIVPIVMDELNFIQNIHHHFKAYGGWSFALNDYTELNFTRCLDHPNTAALMGIVDPINYADRYRPGLPKLVINSGMDEFLMPDNTRFWWDRMPEPKRFLMIPNAEHSEVTGILEILPDLATFLNRVVDSAGGSPAQQAASIPQFAQFRDSASGDITVVVDEGALPAGVALESVHVWHATTCNAERRDFRVVSLGWGPGGTSCLPCLGVKVKGLCPNLKVLWSKEALNETAPGTGTYVAHRDVPSGGRWTAFFVDVQFSSGTDGAEEEGEEDGERELLTPQQLGWPVLGKQTFEFTSEVSVIPDTYPFADCAGESCAGHLV